MQHLDIAYAGRIYSPRIARRCVTACLHEIQFLYAHADYKAQLWNNGQFEQIAAALELHHGSDRDLSRLSTSLSRTYKRATLCVHVPVPFYFRTTIAVESLFALPSVRDRTMDLHVLRCRWKRLMIISHQHQAEVFAWDQCWGLPASVPRPVLEFEAHWNHAQLHDLFAAAGFTKVMFGRLWSTYTQQLVSTSASISIACRRHGRNWVHYVSPQSALAAQLDLELLLLTASTRSDAAEAFESFQKKYLTPEQDGVPPTLLFDPTLLTSATAEAARAPRHYALDADSHLLHYASPTSVKRFCCRFCPDACFDDCAAWLVHLELHDGLMAYRQQVLAAEAAAWPSPVDQRLVRQCMSKYATAFWRHMHQEPSACCVCAVPGTAEEIELHNLRLLPFDFSVLHDLLSALGYVARHAQLYPDPRPDFFEGLPVDTVLAISVPVPEPLRPACEDGWLLHLDAALRSEWHSGCQNVAVPLPFPLCSTCCGALQKSPPRLPTRALANGNLCLPLPPELCDLTLAERIFIARGFTVRRLHTLPGPTAPTDRQKAFSGNVISFPQNSATVVRSLPRHPDEAAELLTVFFPSTGEHQFLSTKAYLVRRQRVRDALEWLRCHNPFFADIAVAAEHLALLPQHGVLPHLGLASASGGNPVVPEAGPADALLSSQEQALPLAAAVLDVEGEGLMPGDLWREALGVAPAADASSEQQPVAYDVMVPHGEEPLSSYHLGYYVLCFPHLFPYGDGVCGGARRVQFPLRAWARHLLLRTDRLPAYHPWSLDIDFICVLFSIVHRQELLRAIHIKVHSPSFTQHSADIAALLESNFAAVARVLQDHGGIVEALRIIAAIVASFFASFVCFFCVVHPLLLADVVPGPWGPFGRCLAL